MLLVHVHYVMLLLLHRSISASVRLAVIFPAFSGSTSGLVTAAEMC